MAVETKAAEEVQRFVQGLLEQVIGDADYLEMDGFYRVRVRLGDRDSVVLRAPLAGALADAIAPAAGVVNAMIGAGDEARMQAALQEVLAGDAALWGIVDQVLTPCIVSWELPEFIAVYGRTPDMPVGDMPAEKRLEAYRAMPPRMLWRLLVGLFWHRKNSSRSSPQA